MENITTGKLIEMVAEKTGLAKQDVQSALDAVSETIVETLAGGGRVEIRNFASFTVEERAPRLARHPRTQATIVVPMTRRVRVRVAQGVRKRVADETLSSGAGLYVCAGDDPWVDEVRAKLAEIGYDVWSGSSFAEALSSSAVKASQLSFVMFGPSFDDEAYARTAIEVKIDSSTSMLPVVRGEAAPAPRPQPGSVRVVPDAAFDSAEAAVEVVRDEAEQWREEKLFFGRQVTLKAASDVASIESLKKLLEGFYRDVLADETETYKTLSAFRESIDNAAAHGNKNSPEKCLTVTLMQDDTRLALDVKDEGPGFEHDRFVDTSTGLDAASVARERLGRGSSGGLGIRLMHECVDEVRYSEGGTRVTLLKRRGGASPASS